MSPNFSARQRPDSLFIRIVRRGARRRTIIAPNNNRAWRRRVSHQSPLGDVIARRTPGSYDRAVIRHARRARGAIARYSKCDVLSDSLQSLQTRCSSSARRGARNRRQANLHLIGVLVSAWYKILEAGLWDRPE